jgi:sugar/nucleoside kinase (ribokinase family)
VGRNISETASRLGIETIFITALANDSNSHEIRQTIQSYGIKLNEVQVDSMKAPTFLSILDDNKDSIISISDMDINQALTLSNIRQSFFSSE